MALPVQETMPFPRVSETWPKPPVFQSRNLGYNAQTVVAGSYGYMQLGFWALKSLHWLQEGVPNPTDLETADTNISLGSRWLTKKKGYTARHYGGNGRTSLSDFENYFVWLCTLYNGYSETNGTSYGQKVVLTVAPQYQPQILAQ